ncbi:MAG: tetratricopeptide repeat protein [Vicinamibacterales bacterium]
MRRASSATPEITTRGPPETIIERTVEYSMVARVLIPLLLIAAGVAAFHNGLAGSFLLDDEPRILVNPQIRQLWPPWPAMAGSSRPMVELSLAVNHALGGLNARGYHAFNIVVHLLAGLLLFGIVRRMLVIETLRPRYGRAAPWLAGAIAIIWTVHPLQTESVTYIIQRAESMMGLFLLLTLYCGIRGASSRHPSGWYLASIIACGLGMGSKEVMVAAPVVMLLYDRMFISPSFRDLVRWRWWFYVGLAATWLILGALMAGSRAEEQVVLVRNLTPWRYALTQFGVIVHYLRLAFWPHPLVLDYAWPLAETASSILPWAAIVLMLIGATLVAIYRRSWAGFWGAWFFLILAPTSSIVPIGDIAFEHRMYLPLAAVVVLAVIGAYTAFEHALGRLAAPMALRRWLEGGLVAAAVVALIFVTVRRNDDYRDDSAMWRDIASKRPDNPRAHFNFGVTVHRSGKPVEAIEQFSEALRLKPDYVDARLNLGAALRARQARPGGRRIHRNPQDQARLCAGAQDACRRAGEAGQARAGCCALCRGDTA